MTHGIGKTYIEPDTKEFTFGSITLNLPRLMIGDRSIYVLNILGGDPQLTVKMANELYLLLDNFRHYEGFITVEGKGIPLVYQLANQTMRPFYVLRKCHKAYMGNSPISAEVNTITTGKQSLYLDDKDKNALCGRRWLFVDDVISSGATLRATIELVEKAYGTVIGALALAIEGDYKPSLPTYYLAHLPIT